MGPTTNTTTESTAAESTGDEVAVLGISHRTAPFDVLERLALSAEEITALYARLAAAPEISDALVLSTCNRTEIYTLAKDAHVNVWGAVAAALRDIAGQRFPDENHLYRSLGKDGVRHLFRVACGLDSLVLGETQILGQVKDAYDQSRTWRPPSPYFDHLVQAAFRVARQSRADTEIGKGAVSVASASVHLATRIYSDLSRRTVVIVGAGDTGRLAAEHFAKHGPGRLLVLNRSPERAEQVARDVGGEAHGLERLPSALAEADIVACAVSVKEPIITVAMVNASLRHRSGRPLALLDLGLPRNVAAEVNDVANVFLHDLEALRQVVDGNLARRRREVPRVEELIQHEVDRLLERHRVQQAGPLIAALRDAVESVRKLEVEKATAKLGPAEREAVDRATRAVVNKLLHGPTTSIKAVARQQEEGAERLELIRALFGNLGLGGVDEPIESDPDDGESGPDKHSV